MAFLNPLLLFGTAAIAAPIIIHLLQRRRLQRVVWAAMRFLRVAIEKNQRRMRLEDRLLLFLRCLLLLLLALALARPALRAANARVLGLAQTVAVIVIDNSASMSQSDGVQSRFDTARGIAEQIVDALPPDSSAALLLASDIVQELIPEPTRDMNLIRKTVHDPNRTDHASNLLPFQQAVAILNRRTAPRKEIYVITDGQALAWRQADEIRQLLTQNQPTIRAHVVFVGDPEEDNLAVTGLHLTSGLAPLDQPLRFEVQVTNAGREPANAVRVGLSVDADPPIEEGVIDVIPPGSAKSVSLFAKLRTEGFHTLTAAIPQDRFPADDRRTIVVRAIKEVRVLLVDGVPGPTPRESGAFYLRHALVPVPPTEATQYFIKTSTVTATDLESARLDDFDAVILVNVPDLTATTLTALEQYLQRGGGLIVFPGPNINVTFYNDQLLGRYGFLPATLEPARGDADAQDKFATLQEPSYEHPIAALWNDPAAGTLASAHFYRFFPLQPAKWPLPATPAAGQPQVILKLADGTPAVLERPWGYGRVILFASTANTAWNDLPVRLVFVPLIHRTLGFILQRQNEGLNILVGKKFVYRADAGTLGKDAIITQPGHTAQSRDYSRVELADGFPTLQFQNTDQGGAYDIAIATDPPTPVKFAAQLDPAESSVEPLAPGQKDALAKVAHVMRWSAEVSLRETLERERLGTELWLPIALLALLVGVFETHLAQRFSRSK